MRVDQSRHDPLAGGIDHLDGLAIFYMHVGRQRADALDPVVLDDDGVVARRRLSGAVDQGAIADHQGLFGGAHWGFSGEFLCFAHTIQRRAKDASAQPCTSPPPPGEGEGKHSWSRDASASESSSRQRDRRRRHGTPSQAKPSQAKPSNGNGAPGGARVVGRATRTDVATRSRFGRGARHRRFPCGNRLLRARCASRRSTAIRRPGCRPPQALGPHPLRRIAVSVRRLVRKRDEAPKAPLDGACQGQTKLRFRFLQAVGARMFFSARRTKMTGPAMSCRAERRSLRNDSLTAH